MKKLHYSLAALALVVLAACTKDEVPSYLSDPDAVRIEAAVGALTKSNPLGTVEEQRKFNEGDRIAVANGGKTVVYKLQSGAWAPENSSEYLKWDKSDLKFAAEYPIGYTTLPTDQSTVEKLTAADRMYVEATYNDIPENRILSAELFRKNVLVKIKIANYLDQYKEGKTFIEWLGIGQYWTGNQISEAYMVASPLVLDKDGNPLDGKNKGTVGNTYAAIVRPNKKGDNSDKNLIYMNITGEGADQSNGDFLAVKGGQELLAGHAYTFELYVGKNTVKIGDITVNEWTTGAPLPDGETDPVDTWDGQTTEAFATTGSDGSTLGYSGTSPILIRTGAQLAYLAEQVDKGNSYRGMYFKLADDLNLAGKSWSPIGYKSESGTSDTPFCGFFDGAGHEIMGLKVDANQNYLGLFGYIRDARLKNLKISSADISSNGGYGAILCAFAEGTTISNCSVSGKVKIENQYAGGIVAMLQNSEMEKCTAEVDVTGTQHVGGLCGKLDYGFISNCTVLSGSTLSVTQEKNVIPSVGGLVGYISSEGSNLTKIGQCSTYAKVSGFGNVGGAIGYVDADKSHQIGECTVYGDVSVDALPSGQQNLGIGGFIGSLKYKGETPSFSKCGFNGTITNADGTSVSGNVYGAFVGFDEGKATFADCWYNADKTGELSSVGTGVKDKDYTGITAKNLGK